MTFTILLIGGAVLGTTALFAIATRGSAVHPALASDNTAVGLRDASVDTLLGGTPPQAAARTGNWQLTTVNDLHDAEDLLDYLEANGAGDRELVVLGESCFAVRWR